MCRGSRHIHAVTSSLETVDIDIPQRKAITARYTLLLHTYSKRVKKYSCSFHSLRLIITIGSLIVPALLSVQYTNENTIPSDISVKVYWIVWVLSLFVTISNGVVTLLKIDKKYYSLHTVYQQLLSEGWQYIHLTGKYNGLKTPGIQPTHENQYTHFCHSIDKIHMKSVEDEYYKVNEANQTPGADPLVPPTPFQALTNARRRQANLNSQLEINGSSSVSLQRQNSATSPLLPSGEQRLLSNPLLPPGEQRLLSSIEEASEGSSMDEQDTTAVPMSSNLPQQTSSR
jgi:hypothetical protein